MPRKLTFRQLLLSILALRYDVSQKEIGARAGIPEANVSYYLSRERRRDMKEDAFERMLAAVPCPPAAVKVVSACLEALEALEKEGLTAEEQAVIEEAVLDTGRMVREALTESVRRSRSSKPVGYPDADDLDLDRARAEELFSRLVKLPEEIRLAVVRVAEEYQSWALCEKVCAVSSGEASRSVERAAAWARLAEEIAERVRGPEHWRSRIQGYAVAHGANVLRVAGDLKASETAFERAKHLWLGGSDPGVVLDPGRLLDLEASLRRDQRRLGEALFLLDEAAAVGRHPERALLKKGFTLEVLGDYERAVETLLQADPLVRRGGDTRLLYMLRFNLAVNYCHLGRYREASELVQEVRDLVLDRGDENEILRVNWLEGRIAAGLGRSGEARKLLGEVRRAFGLRGMSYDVALALLEEAVLLLEEGRSAEVKALAGELAQVFEDKGVHREALAALRLFHEAAEHEEATAELARRVLRFLFRARYDQGLRFNL
ncbi:MAG TPA: tetratricopeptide repeat protein [Thermoanaerobaculia bacterium]|jgi:tetratricopeptide (TPR) repeat protein